ncbi:RND family transporter [Roseivirga sp. BDSF3-8]|uniref:efflux RND transporter permease subunit n=1 Tax=Roseivirga sp. BDSF3-8 TaxID=3241598 RepID=UPI003531CD52
MPKKYALPLLIVILLISAWQAGNIRSLKFDYNFENFLPVGDEDLSYYRYFRENFESDNDYLLVGITSDHSVTDPDFINKLNGLTKRLNNLAAVNSVVSPTRQGERRVLADGNVISLPWLNEGGAGDSLRIMNNRPLTWPVIDDDLKRISLLVNLEPVSEKKASDLIVDSVYQAIYSAGFKGERVAVAGKARAQKHYVNLMQEELPTLLGLSVLVVLALLYMFYRSLWWTSLPLATVGLTVLWAIGFMAVAGIPVDIMMVALPSIIFVVATSDVIHLLTRYLEELRRGLSAIMAMKLAFREVGLATFLTSITTAAGFFTLLTASIRPIRSFGVVVGTGVFLAFVITFTFLPALLTLLPKPSITKVMRSGEKWEHLLHRLLDWSLSHRKVVIAGSLLITIISVFGASKVETDSFLISDLPETDPLMADFQYIDRYFGGSRSLEITMTLPDTADAYELGTLRAMEAFQRDIAEGPIRVVASPLLLAYATNQALSGGDPEAFRLPQGDREISRFRRYIRRSRRYVKFPIEADSGRVYRISARIADIGSKKTLAELDRLQTAAEGSIYAGILSPRFTGTSLLIDQNNETLTRNMFVGLGLAMILVGIIASLLYKSPKMALIALIPNLLPILMTAAVMGFSGITLRLSTSVIFTIAFGIAVDDTLHFLSKLRLMEKRGIDRNKALHITFRLTGKAIVVTTLLLSAGFMTFLFSRFGAIYYMGLLVSVTLVSALVVDLLLLPVILSYFKPDQPSTT